MFMDGWRTFFAYAGCAAGIGLAVGTVNLVLAAMGCAGLLIEALDG